MKLSYGELLRLNRTGAREKLLEEYIRQGGNISRTARVCGTSRNVVRKWAERHREHGLSGLEDLSRRPHHMPRKTPDGIEELVVKERTRTNFGPQRLRRILHEKYGVELCESTIKRIIRRRGLVRKRRRSKVGKLVNVYGWEEFPPLQFFQLDLKDIADQKTLPPDIYNLIFELGLPRYQFTVKDVKTRMRFACYGYEKSFINGYNFMLLVLAWLRLFGIYHRVYFQSDWGEEFGGKSIRKIERINRELDKLGATLLRIAKGKPNENAFVERVHRTDDEEFYLLKLREVKNVEDFIDKAFHWNFYYNYSRGHSGKGMDGKTPFQKAKEEMDTLNPTICCFPPLILDKLLKDHKILEKISGGNNVLTHYVFYRKLTDFLTYFS